MALVSDYMATELITVGPDTDIEDAIDLMVNNRISGMSVVDHEQRLVGVLSERDFMRLVAIDTPPEQLVGKVRDFMSHDLKVVPPEMTIPDLANLFLEHNVRRFPVVREGRLVGQISRHDCLRALLG